MYADERMLKVLKQCQLQTFHVADRILAQSGDIEENPGPSHQCSVNTNSSDTSSSVSLLESRLSSLNRTALDVGGGDNCFFRAVSHQLFGNPNNHFHVCSLGVQYLEQCPESNTESSRLYYLNNISCQGTWADALLKQWQIVSIYQFTLLNQMKFSFLPQPVNMTRGYTNIHIAGHIGEMHYVSTLSRRKKF